ncbi:MAG: hypothetical protein LBP58_05245 [Azoarcus sp.]|jgi:hypothetical protein|nr:hypothetical protein [Azoarcus sp.]
MNQQISSLLAELAEASYAVFIDENGELVDRKEALVGEGFSSSQADSFLARWEMVDHQPDMDSGFSATLFKSTDPDATEPYVLAIRGTAGLHDLVIADGSDIVMDGLAIDQIVDLYN